MSSFGSIEDRLAIRELYETYSDAGMRRDAEIWGNTWADDAVWLVPSLGVEAKGRGAIVDMWKGAMDTVAFAGFFSFPGEIVVKGDGAAAHCYQQEHLDMSDGTHRFVIGLYTDDLVRRNGRWYFEKRSYQVLRMEEKKL